MSMYVLLSYHYDAVMAWHLPLDSVCVTHDFSGISGVTISFISLHSSVTITHQHLNFNTRAADLPMPARQVARLDNKFNTFLAIHMFFIRHQPPTTAYIRNSLHNLLCKDTRYWHWHWHTVIIIDNNIENVSIIDNINDTDIDILTLPMHEAKSCFRILFSPLLWILFDHDVYFCHRHTRINQSILPWSSLWFCFLPQ